jgi:DNA-binding MarR family transcriptional regulator
MQEDRTLLFEVWLVANSTRALLDGALRSAGLNAEDFALYSLLARGGTTPTELAGMMALPRATVSSIVRRLERRGHSRRVPDPHDGRSYRIELTQAGRSAHARAGRLFLPVLAHVESGLGIPLAQARSVLSAIDAAVRAATAD